MKKTSLLLGFVLLNGLGLLLMADPPQKNQTTEPRPGRTSTKVQQEGTSPELEITKVQEAAALAFAQMYHPELSGLLQQLKKVQPKSYAKAIRDLYSTMTKLETLRERAPHRYETALEMWQIDSRIRLVSARMSKSSSPELEQQLKGLLAQRYELKLHQARQEKDRLEYRLMKLNTNIDNLQKNRDAELEKDFLRIQRSWG